MSPRIKKSSQNLRGKVALITGASQGIGLAIARALAAEGCNLVISSRNKTALAKACRELKAKNAHVLPRLCDVRDPVFRDLPFDSWREVIDTNLNGMFLITRDALPLMKSGGVIVNNLSIAAKRVFAGSSAYNASKHGALGFTNTLREELREKGIRVIALLPGATDTAIWNTLWPEAPRKKMMQPETVAQALVNALILPAESTVEELVIMPSAGTL